MGHALRAPEARRLFAKHLRQGLTHPASFATFRLQQPDQALPHHAQAISNSLWSYSKLAYNPGQRLLDTAARRAAGMLHQYTSQEIANTLWAFATLEHNPSSAMLDAAALQIARRIEQFSPQVRVPGCRCRCCWNTLLCPEVPRLTSDSEGRSGVP